MRRRGFNLVTIGWASLTLVLLGSCGGKFGSLPRGLTPQQLNVVVITLDTTRADRLGCYVRPG